MTEKQKYLRWLTETAYDKRPLDAVNFLLDRIRMLDEALAGDEHEVDSWGMDLKPAERRVLIALVDWPNSTRTREQLHEALMFGSRQEHISYQNVNVHVKNLRDKLPPERGRIATHHTVGYLFEPPSWG